MKRPLAKVADGWVPITHGIPSSYNRGCRCDACRAAHCERIKAGGHVQQTQAKRKAERVEVGGRLIHPNPYGGHGTLTAYTSCGCRCHPCSAAMKAYQRERRTRGAS